MSVEKQCCNCANETDDEKLSKINEYVSEIGQNRNNLIQILHMAQGLFGYLPLDVQRFIAEKLSIPLSEVYGVVTFYSYFSTKPKGKYEIGVCLGTACYVRGGKKILAKLQDIMGIGPGDTTEDKKFSLEVMRCVGACGLAPVITVNGEVHRQVNPDKLKSILATLE